jgi:hypothetical protein
MYAETYKRSLLIAGLRDFATYLETHPDVPAPIRLDVMVFPDRGSDSAVCAEIDRIADVIGAPVTDERGEFGHYETARSFGPVTYSAIAILAKARAHHDAHMSYHGSVIPDAGQTPTAAEGR